MSESTISRRHFLRGIAVTAVGLPMLRLPAQAALPHLAESDPAAKGLGYVENAAKLDPAKEPAYKKGAICKGCALYTAAQAEGGFAPCAAFPGKAVAEGGWCRAFAAKPA